MPDDTTAASAASAPGWLLQGEGVDGQPLLLPLRRLPWRIGREADNDLVLLTAGVSRHHAELRLDRQGQLRLVDHDSRNGSFVNGLRVVGSSAPLSAGDRLHLGAAMLLLQALDAPPQPDIETAAIALPRQPVPAPALQELLAGRGLRLAFQPLCRVDDGRAFGGELLGRAAHPQLPEDPLPLLALAAEARCEAALSQAWRALGLPLLARHLAPVAERLPVFLNIHPREPLDERLLDPLQALADAHPQLQLVVELQPARLEDEELPGFAQLLEVLGMQLGFEHLTALPAAALERLAALRPRYLKLHPSVASGLHAEHAPRVRLLRHWQQWAAEAGAELVLTGVEQAEALDLARRLGLRWAQGFLTGPPRLLD